MSAVPSINLDRRANPRTNINSQIKYWLTNNTSCNFGIVLNISQYGIALGLDQEIPTNSKLNVLMESEQKDEAPIEMITEIVRISKSFNDHAYSYGCKILEVKDF